MTNPEQRFLKTPGCKAKFGHALAGLRTGIGDASFRIQCVAAFLVIGAAFYFSVTPMEWCVLLICIMSVLALELINSSIEKISTRHF